MDAADLFRQAQSSVKQAREAKSFRVRESSHESDDHSPRIAHTLTACCRCRQVRSLLLIISGIVMLTLHRERRDATLIFHGVSLAKELVQSASISTLQRARRYPAHMLYDFKTKCGHWRRNLASIPRRRGSLKTQKTSCGRGASSV